MNNGLIKVVIAKIGLDGHNRGAKIISRGLSEAGMEVVYTGMKQTPQMVVNTVIQEDADVLGLSILSGAHMFLVPEVISLLKEKGANQVKIIVGGTIPKQDIPVLYDLGVSEVFTPGSTIAEIVDLIHSLMNGNHE